MKRKREYLLILAITCLSWGFFFTEYAFTTDSYRVIIEESNNGSEDAWEEASVQDGDLQSAIRSGRVRYKWKFAEYIRSLFWESGSGAFYE